MKEFNLAQLFEQVPHLQRMFSRITPESFAAQNDGEGLFFLFSHLLGSLADGTAKISFNVPEFVEDLRESAKKQSNGRKRSLNKMAKFLEEFSETNKAPLQNIL